MDLADLYKKLEIAQTSLEHAAMQMAVLYVDARIHKQGNAAQIELINLKVKSAYEECSALVISIGNILNKKNEPIDISEFVFDQIVKKTRTSKI